MATLCYRHPDRPTGVSCVRCGRPICPECMTPASVGFQCPECVRGGQAGLPAPRPARLQGAGRRWGPVTLGLIAANVAMFVVTAAAAGLAGNNPLDNYQDNLWLSLAQVPVLVDLGQWWRVLTAAFMHIGPLHLALNMLALLLFGTELERRLGRVRFAGLYLVSILGGAAGLQLFADPGSATAGASTAIYGLLGALGVLMIAGREDLRGLLTLLAINIAISFLPGLSLAGHLGGLVAGALVTVVLLAARRRPIAQAVGVGALGVLLLAVALTMPTVAVIGL